MKKLIIFIYCAEKTFSVAILKKILCEIDKTKIPDFPFSGKHIIDQGIDDGKKIGFALKEIEKEWVNNNFNLSTQDVSSIIDRIKKLNILNV